MINKLNTWFRISDNAILARDYSLSYRTLVYDFDVDMNVKLKQVGKDLVPFEIRYIGDWKVAFKGRGKSQFYCIIHKLRLTIDKILGYFKINCLFLI